MVSFKAQTAYQYIRSYITEGTERYERMLVGSVIIVYKWTY